MKFYTNWFLRGKTLFVKHIDENGIRQRSKHAVTPSLFVKRDSDLPTDYRDIFDNPVHEVEFDSPKEAREFA
jgi:hypothetical protein